jgi:hypothetical protein
MLQSSLFYFWAIAYSLVFYTDSISVLELDQILIRDKEFEIKSSFPIETW